MPPNPRAPQGTRRISRNATPSDGTKDPKTTSTHRWAAFFGVVGPVRLTARGEGLVGDTRKAAALLKNDEALVRLDVPRADQRQLVHLQIRATTS